MGSESDTRHHHIFPYAFVSLPDVHRVEEKHDAIYRGIGTELSSSAGVLVMPRAKTMATLDTECLRYGEQAVTQVATRSSPARLLPLPARVPRQPDARQKRNPHGHPDIHKRHVPPVNRVPPPHPIVNPDPQLPDRIEVPQVPHEQTE